MAATDPTDLSIPSFQRVSHIDFDNEVEPLRTVAMTVADADEDW